MIRPLAALVVLLAAAATSFAASPRRPDLAVRSLSGVPRAVAPGGTFTAVLRTANLGRRTARPSAVALFLSRDRRRDRADRRLATRRTRTLRPRRRARTRVRVRLPATAAPGAYHLLACADPFRRVREAREANNCRGRRLRVRGPAAGPVAGQGASGFPSALPAPATLPEPEPGGAEAPPGAAPVEVRGRVAVDGGAPVAGAEVSARAGGATSAAVTGADGRFDFQLPPTALPGDVVVRVRHRPAGLPAVDSARTRHATTGPVDLGTIVLPDPAGAEVSLTAGAGRTSDGSVQVSGMPAAVHRLFARSFDPDAAADAFPGEFAEHGNIPLDSAVFVWMEALDAAGSAVDRLTPAATVRVRVPRSQWDDLEDIRGGTDRIELPIYVFDEGADVWRQELPDGWLEDGVGTVLPEDAGPSVLDGSLPGDVFAAYTVSHLSWQNVDYGSIGPWTVSRMDPEQRNTDCFRQGAELAATIARSQAGHLAFSRVNVPGADLDDELAPGQGPEIVTGNLGWTKDTQVNGDYDGDEGGPEDQFALNNALWDSCDDPGRKQDTILSIASSILHETAHWKDDVKRTPGADPSPEDTADSRFEEGKWVERFLFGGDLQYDPVDERLEVDMHPVPQEDKDRWMNPAGWPPRGDRRRAPAPVADRRRAPAPAGEPRSASPLDIHIELDAAGSTFDLHEPVPVQVTYENTGAAPIRVLGAMVLEDLPLRFEIVHAATGRSVGFLGPEHDTAFGDDQFVTLAPGKTLTRTVDLNLDERGRPHRYALHAGDAYEARAVYTELLGLPETTSNAISFTMNRGGGIAGTVRNAETGEPIAGASVVARSEGLVLQRDTTDARGAYAFDELPDGDYTVEARAKAHLRASREAFVEAPDTQALDLAPAPLMTKGQLRLVLSWADEPADLDAHLWLPEDRPFHVHAGRRGLLTECPFAVLDVEDDDGSGPETITLPRRFPGTYGYAVHDDTGRRLVAGSQAIVQVFSPSGLIATHRVNFEFRGAWWQVLEIDGETGRLDRVNRVGDDDPAPYADTGAGCPPAAMPRRPPALLGR